MNNLTRYETEDGIELVIDQQTGEAYATQAGYARMSGLSQQAINKRTQQTYNQDQLKFAELQTPQGLRLAQLIPIDMVLEFLVKDNPDLINPVISLVEEITGKVLPLPKIGKRTQTKHKQPEKKVQKSLAKSLNGKIEVPCKTGNIDVLTDSEIIEIKKAKDWKHAIGQVLVYQLEYPDRQARIHLYEECSQEFKQMVISFASKLNVTATFE